MHPSSREYLDRGENLPLYYGEDRLVLLPRDPYWLFAYWEISWPTRQLLAEETQKDYESLDFGLRVHRYTENKEAGTFFDLQITPTADHWYIKAGVPDKKYWVELGCYLPDGEFRVILTSNTVSTPRDSLSGHFFGGPVQVTVDPVILTVEPYFMIAFIPPAGSIGSGQL
jgi:hypothetical protein